MTDKRVHKMATLNFFDPTSQETKIKVLQVKLLQLSKEKSKYFSSYAIEDPSISMSFYEPGKFIKVMYCKLPYGRYHNQLSDPSRNKLQ